jgi:hypothetical protein
MALLTRRERDVVVCFEHDDCWIGGASVLTDQLVKIQLIDADALLGVEATQLKLALSSYEVVWGDVR